MSEAVLSIPVSRLFARPAPPAGPSAAERERAAVEAAFAAGEAAGEARAMLRIAELEAELETVRGQHVGRLAAMAETHAAALHALDAALAEAVGQLGFEIARHVLAREPALGSRTVETLVADALAGLPEGGAGTLRMNPSDATDAPALPSGWVLVADPALAPGQMVAERGRSLSAAGLSQRLEQLRERLEGRA